MNLLAIDLGVKTGLACWDVEQRKLLWCRSHNYGSKKQVAKAAPGVLLSAGDAGILVLEGGGDIALIWKQAGNRWGWDTRILHAEEWRKNLFYESEWQYTSDLKNLAINYAHKAALWGGMKVAGRLNHNAAEALLAGLWVLLEQNPEANIPWPMPWVQRSK